jgi:hypothetical protein
MTIDTNTTSRRPVRGLLLIVAALLVTSLAWATAQAASAAGRPRYLSSARSIELLRTAFGSVSAHPFREPRVVVAPTSAATWALADDVNVANQAWDPRAGRVWSRGDAKAMWPDGMGGFTDPQTGTVYVNGQTAVESAMPHELLHANASPDFLQAVGVAVNEGVTEQLALDALARSGVRAEKAPAYAQYRELAAAIVAVTGRDRLLKAYFNGGQDLAELTAALGTGTVDQVKAAAAANNTAGALQIIEASGPGSR